MSAFSYQPLLLVNSDGFSCLGHPEYSTSRPPFSLYSRHFFSLLCSLSSRFILAGFLFCSPNIHPVHPSIANQRNRLRQTRNLSFALFSLFLFLSCANLFTACISSCTHCLLQVSASCGATARRGFESPFCCMHAAYARWQRGENDEDGGQFIYFTAHTYGVLQYV
ncbi:hypothetical protein J3E68DRAFT_416312 [Trichoderma sp. SZMC 28012]